MSDDIREHAKRLYESDKLPSWLEFDELPAWQQRQWQQLAQADLAGVVTPRPQTQS